LETDGRPEWRGGLLCAAVWTGAALWRGFSLVWQRRAAAQSLGPRLGQGILPVAWENESREDVNLILKRVEVGGGRGAGPKVERWEAAALRCWGATGSLRLFVCSSALLLQWSAHLGLPETVCGAGRLTGRRAWSRAAAAQPPALVCGAHSRAAREHCLQGEGPWRPGARSIRLAGGSRRRPYACVGGRAD